MHGALRPMSVALSGILTSAGLVGCAPLNAEPSPRPSTRATLPVWTEAVTNGVRFHYCQYRDEPITGVPRRVAFWSIMAIGQPWASRRQTPPAAGFVQVPLVLSTCPASSTALRSVLQDADASNRGLPRVLPDAVSGPPVDPDRLQRDWVGLWRESASQGMSTVWAIDQLVDRHEAGLAVLIEQARRHRDRSDSEPEPHPQPPGNAQSAKAAQTLAVLQWIIQNARAQYDSRSPAPGIEHALKPLLQAHHLLTAMGVKPAAAVPA